MACSFTRSRGRQGSARQTEWVGFGTTSVTLTASGGTVIGVGNAALLAFRPFTIVRTHFEFFLRSDQTAAAEYQVVAFSGAIVSD